MTGESGIELLPCPFCGGAMQLRYALWPSEGDRDAVIHNVPGGTACPIEGAFSIDTFDNGVSVAEAWNRRHPPASREEGLRDEAQRIADGSYGRYIDQMQSKDCLGFEAKLRNGSFGQAQLDAHVKAGEWLGRHRAYAEIAAKLSALIPTKPEAKEGAERRALVALVAASRAVLQTLKPGQALSPAGASLTNRLDSITAEIETSLALQSKKPE